MAGSNVGRAWRRFRRRPAVVQAGVGLVVVAVVVGVVVAVAAGGGGKSTSGTVAAGPTTAPPTVAATTAPFAQVAPSTRGITPTSIELVFPVANLNALSDQIGFAGDPEFPEQSQAINFFVKEINDAGGINGRQLHASIVPYDPTNAAASRALCKDWTEGTPGAFAVIDGLGTVAGDEQLCVTQEGSTPLLSAWTTVTDWTTKGAPYLWWLGPDQSAILQALVTWGQGAGLLGGSNKVGIVVSDQADDQAALNNYLLPDLRKAGVTDAVVQTLPGNPSDSASTAAQAPLVVQRLKAAGVQSLIPLIPFNAFFPELQAQTQQSYFPHLLLSDYQSSINTGLGLLPVPYEKALDGQEGITAETLGASDDARPQGQGGYNAGARSCYTDWVKAFPQVPAGKKSNNLEAQGPVVGWCQAIRLFAAAATKAGPDLNRRTFVQSMGQVSGFDGTWYPTLTYGPAKFFGPTEYEVVRLHTNDPHNNACPLTFDGTPQGTCWQVVSAFQPLPPTVGTSS
jgi:hypothetical protein